MRLLATSLLLFASLAQTQTAVGQVYEILDCKGRVCTIARNGGGIVERFEQTAASVHRNDQLVIVDRPCASACALLADKARDRVCITPSAKFMFHRGVNIVTRQEILVFHSRDIAEWIQSRGGFPSNPSGLFLEMTYGQARQFWPACNR